MEETTMTAILADYGKGRQIDSLPYFTARQRHAVQELTEDLFLLLFPGGMTQELPDHIRKTFQRLVEQIDRAYAICGREGERGEAAAQQFMTFVPQVRALLQTDLEAALAGDPAATGMAEILCCYPGFFAVTVHRLAHVLYTLNVPLLPRIMSEYAHSVTGIDIHPGAQVGSHFFIDHGTGVVIGQTTRIGSHVKLYQGVTLGALSLRGGRNLHGVRRHPTLEDRVTVYAGATILGGDTVIGAHSVIGANAFITSSVQAGTTVKYGS